jgi:hypothetical protein
MKTQTESATKPVTKAVSRTKVNLMVDSAIFFAFLFVTAPHFTGLAIHEWLGIAFGAGIITHLALHWQWIVSITQRIFSHIPRQQRINYLLNVLLFVDIALTAVSGVMISQHVVPFLGIRFQPSQTFRGLHSAAGNASLVLVGLHVALHWSWIVNAVKKYVLPAKAASVKPAMPRLAPAYNRLQKQA